MNDKNNHNQILSKVPFILFDFKFEHAAVEVLYILRYDMQAVLLKITVCQMKVFLNKAESILINYARLINYAPLINMPTLIYSISSGLSNYKYPEIKA